MRRSITFRLENNLFLEIETMSKTRDIPFSQVLSELLELGLKAKKYMENKKSGGKEESSINNHLLEKGAASAIETLLLLRRIAKETNPNWVEEANAETAERITSLTE